MVQVVQPRSDPAMHVDGAFCGFFSLERVWCRRLRVVHRPSPLGQERIGRVGRTQPSVWLPCQDGGKGEQEAREMRDAGVSSGWHGVGAARAGRVVMPTAHLRATGGLAAVWTEAASRPTTAANWCTYRGRQGGFWQTAGSPWCG